MRGLKFLSGLLSFGFDSSHPAWDAWIEIERQVQRNNPFAGRIPHGMRGLKFIANAADTSEETSHPAWDAWIEIVTMVFLLVFLTVASRMGCVD